MDRDNKQTCGICQQHAFQYTCPKCNVPYCSLACFRSEKHAQCSEPFYRREVESQIRSQPSASAEERQQMLEVLNKFEQDSLEQENQSPSEEESAEDDLVRRLQAIDIDSISASQLWDMLGPQERASFLKTVGDPASASLRELMKNINFQEIVTLPWWEAPNEEGAEESHQSRMTYGSRPPIIQIPPALLRRPGPETGPPLLYNICAVSIAYAYLTRHFGTSPLHSIIDDASAARQNIRELVPFLVDRHSRVILSSMDDVISELWPRLVNTGKVERSSFVLLLQDTVHLLFPQKVVAMPLEEAGSNRTSMTIELSPHRNVLAVLSDLSMLFRGPTDMKETPTTAKLRFYAAHVAVLPPALMASFSAEVRARKQLIESELQGNSLSTEYNLAEGKFMTAKQPESISEKITQRKSRPVIEEMQSNIHWIQVYEPYVLQVIVERHQEASNLNAGSYQKGQQLAIEHSEDVQV